MEKIMDNETETGEKMGIKDLNSNCIFSFAGVKFMHAKSPAVLLHASKAVCDFAGFLCSCCLDLVVSLNRGISNIDPKIL